MGREWYVPSGAIKVSDKLSDAVAYLITAQTGRIEAKIFFGKQAKPVAYFSYRSEQEREKSVTRYFEGRRQHAKRVTDAREAQKAFKHTCQVGDIYQTCWGYDQTNVEFFEIVEIRGKHAVLRELQCVSEATGWDTSKRVPQSGLYVEGKGGEPIRRLIQDGRIKIDDVRTGWPWGKRVAGVVVGEAARWSSYA